MLARTYILLVYFILYVVLATAEWLSAEDREIIFSNIETLYEIHKHLYDELQKSINDISKANQLERCIVNTFNEFVRTFGRREYTCIGCLSLHSFS